MWKPVKTSALIKHHTCLIRLYVFMCVCTYICLYVFIQVCMYGWTSTFGKTKCRTTDISEFRNFEYERNERWITCIRILKIYDNLENWKLMTFRVFQIVKFWKCAISQYWIISEILWFSKLENLGIFRIFEIWNFPNWKSLEFLKLTIFGIFHIKIFAIFEIGNFGNLQN